jgi:hypothetical protein
VHAIGLAEFRITQRHQKGLFQPFLDLVQAPHIGQRHGFEMTSIDEHFVQKSIPIELLGHSGVAVRLPRLGWCRPPMAGLLGRGLSGRGLSGRGLPRPGLHGRE